MSVLKLNYISFYSDNDNFMKRAVSAMGDIPESMKDAMHGIKMGVSSDICDNAKVIFFKHILYDIKF